MMIRKVEGAVQPVRRPGVLEVDPFLSLLNVDIPKGRAYPSSWIAIEEPVLYLVMINRLAEKQNSVSNFSSYPLALYLPGHPRQPRVLWRCSTFSAVESREQPSGIIDH